MSITSTRSKKHRKKQDSFDSLLEQFKANPTQGMNENTLYKIFSSIGLTFGECKYIYNLIDIDKNKELQQHQYWAFHDIFVEGFKKCGASADNNYMLSQAELESEDCRLMQWDDSHNEPILHVDAKEGVKYIVNFMGIRGKVSFFGYLLTWKSLQAMSECGDNKQVTRTGAKCAFKVLSKRKLLTDSDGYEIMKVVGFLKYGIDKGYDQALDFKEFMVLGSAYVLFSEFGVLSHDTTIHKRELLQAVDEQKFTNYFDRISVDTIYKDRQELHFGQFAVGYVLHRLFSSYDVDGNFRLDDGEWSEMTQDSFFNQWAAHWMDEVTFTTQEQIDTVDKEQKDEQYTVKDYLAYGRRRKLKAKKHNHNHHHHKHHKHHHHKHHNVDNNKRRLKSKKKSDNESKKQKDSKQKDSKQKDDKQKDDKQKDDENSKQLLKMKKRQNVESRVAVMTMYKYGEGKIFKFKQFYDLMTCLYSFIMQDADYSGKLDMKEIEQIYQNPQGYLQLDYEKQQSLMGLLGFLEDMKTFKLDIREYLLFYSYEKMLGLETLTQASGIMGRGAIQKIGEESFKLLFNDNIFIKCASKIQLDREVKQSELSENEQIYNAPLCFRVAMTYELKAKRTEQIIGDAARRLKKKS